MSGPLYPTSLADIPVWSKANSVPVAEGRIRFAQLAVLACIAAADGWRAAVAFKGGNALRFVYGNPRGTIDLDFTVLLVADSVGGVPDEKDHLRRRLDTALSWALQRFGVKMKCQRVDRKPKQLDKTLPTYDIGIGFCFRGDPHFADFESPDRMANSVVKLELSFNDVVCATVTRALEPGAAHLTVCSLEDILAEKLRALLQQIPRNRTRPQDVFDVHRMVQAHGPGLDRDRVAEYLVRKSVDRHVIAARQSFRDPQVREKARSGYEALQIPPTELVPFDEAWAAVLRFVDELPLPDLPEV